jgi:ArsR family transcriptional regulator, arsenate/arsenite/antimonite-responsive transcriptional repressor
MRAIEECCSPLLVDPLSTADAETLAAGFKVLSDPVRLRLLSLIANTPGGEVCACDLTGPVGRSQPTVSHHLSILADAGLVEREQRGKWAWYRVVPERVEILQTALAIPALV